MREVPSGSKVTITMVFHASGVRGVVSTSSPKSTVMSLQDISDDDGNGVVWDAEGIHQIGINVISHQAAACLSISPSYLKISALPHLVESSVV